MCLGQITEVHSLNMLFSGSTNTKPEESKSSETSDNHNFLESQMSTEIKLDD